MTTGERIRQARKASNLTQKELASKVGVKFSAIHKYESGMVVNIKWDTVEKLAKALNVSSAWLMCLDDCMDPEDAEFIKSLGYMRKPVHDSPEVDIINFLISERGWQIEKYEDGNYGIMAEDGAELNQEQMGALIASVKQLAQAVVFLSVNDHSDAMISKLKNDAEWMVRECKRQFRVFLSKTRNEHDP